MKRYRQTLDEIIQRLSPVETGWRDEHAEAVINRLRAIPQKQAYSRQDLLDLLENGPAVDRKAARARFEASLTAVRLFLDLSKDEFQAALKAVLGPGTGVERFRKDSAAYCGALEQLGVLEKLAETTNAKLTWSDLLIERLKGGRGSAIKGQRRGRRLEDFVEVLLLEIFGPGRYQARCRFTGARGVSKEKADFAIPSKDDPAILIEAKAYGATGSKQTDVLGDVSRICQEKRADTQFLLVTDGVTWRDRLNDLRKLVDLQNQGQIARIYTQSMVAQLKKDLMQLKREYGLQ